MLSSECLHKVYMGFMLKEMCMEIMLAPTELINVHLLHSLPPVCHTIELPVYFTDLLCTVYDYIIIATTGSLLYYTPSTFKLCEQHHINEYNLYITNQNYKSKLKKFYVKRNCVVLLPCHPIITPPLFSVWLSTPSHFE